MKCPCETYDERVAIKIYDGKIEPDEARKQARYETCEGCLGKLGVGLFDKPAKND